METFSIVRRTGNAGIDTLGCWLSSRTHPPTKPRVRGFSQRLTCIQLTGASQTEMHPLQIQLVETLQAVAALHRQPRTPPARNFPLEVGRWSRSSIRSTRTALPILPHGLAFLIPFMPIIP